MSFIILRKNMKILLLVFAMQLMAVVNAGAQFFSVNIGDGKEVVKTKLINAGFYLYYEHKVQDELTFMPKNMAEDGSVFGKLPETNGMSFVMATASFKNGKLGKLFLCNTETPESSYQIKKGEYAKFRLFEDALFNRANPNYKNFEFKQSTLSEDGRFFMNAYVDLNKQESLLLVWGLDGTLSLVLQDRWY